MARLRPNEVKESHVKGWVKDWFAARKAWHYAPIQNGLGEHGIPDRVGCVPIVVTQQMVGKTIGLFVAVEAKKPGRRGEEYRGATGHQRDNIVAIQTAHGVGRVVDGHEDLVELNITLERIRSGFVNYTQKELFDG